MINCQYCTKECKNANSHRNHERMCKLNPSRQLCGVSDPIKGPEIKKRLGGKGFGNQFTKAYALGLPKPEVSLETRKKISENTRKRNLARGDDVKAKISNSMKQAHADGRAWNIGRSRWNNAPSYPEQFFMQVIANEFIDKDYQTELPFGRYSLDFAWTHKKKCIEIDGEQHQRFLEYAARDREKDKLLFESGWQVMRISWKDMFRDTKQYIKKAKDFIDT